MFEIKISTPSGEAGAICDTLESAIRTVEENTPGVYNKPVTLEGFTVAPGTQEVVRHTKDGFTGFWAAGAANDPAAVVLTPEETGDGLFAGCGLDDTVTWPDSPFYPEVAHAQPLPETLGNLHEYVTHINRHTSCRVALTHHPDDTFYL